MPGVGFEPTRDEVPGDFKSRASTSFATRADGFRNLLGQGSGARRRGRVLCRRVAPRLVPRIRATPCGGHGAPSGASGRTGRPLSSVCSPGKFTRPGAPTLAGWQSWRQPAKLPVSRTTTCAGGRFLLGGTVGSCAPRLAVLACLLAPAAARAQLAPVGVPGGVVRVDLDGEVDIWDHRRRDGQREPLGADLSSPAFGSDLLPSLGDADARIGRITGLPGYRLNLGALATDVLADQGTGVLGLALGLTRSITIFGRVPLVRARVQPHIALDPAGADAGLNPGSTQQGTFFQQF